MSDTTEISGRQTTYTYGRDDFGEYGSLVQPESELHVAEPLELSPRRQPFPETDL